MSKDTGGPAFPIPGLQEHEEFNGMSLRDYFAAKAMQAGISKAGFALVDRYAAVKAYEMADLMIAARAAI